MKFSAGVESVKIVCIRSKSYASADVAGNLGVHPHDRRGGGLDM